MKTSGGTLTVMAATASTPTMALADLLIGLCQRVPMTAAQIARATGADEQTVGAWLERRAAPRGLDAQRVTELAAFVEEMERNIQAHDLPRWLDGQVILLDGANPLDEIAAGRYEQMIGYALGASDGVFT